MRRLPVVLGPVIVLMLLIAGCGTGPRSERVPALLDFTAPTVDGGQISGGDLAGRPLAVWFWAPW